MKASKMNKMLKNSDGFHPVIMGIVVLAIFAITAGIMIMAYSSISSSTLPATYKPVTGETFLDNSNQLVVTWKVAAQTIGSTDGVTAYSITLKNTTGALETLTQGTDYNVTIANNSVAIKPGVQYKNKTLSLSYDSEQGGTNTFTKVDTNMYKGFDLSSIAPIVLAAGLIISIVVGFAMLGKRD